jgi:hypothetical protein
MLIYTLFLCSLATNSCYRSLSYTFDSLAQCQTFERRLAAARGQALDVKGRAYYDQRKQSWDECRSKHIDEWEAVR